MKLTIPRSEIKEAVAGLSRIVLNKTTLPVLSCVKLDVNGHVTMTATDLDQTATYTFAGGTSTGTGTLIVPFQQIKELAKGNDKELIDIETGAKDTCTVTNHVGALAVKIPLNTSTPPDEFPVLPEQPKAQPVQGFLETYRKLIPFASEDATRVFLNSVYLDVSGKGEKPATMVACDGRRMTCCNSIILPIALSTIVPANKFLAWPGLPESEQRIGILTKTVKVKEGKKEVAHEEVKGFGLECGPWSYNCKPIEGNYPTYRQVIPDTEYCTANTIQFTDEDVATLKKIMPTLPGHADERTTSIKLCAGPDGVVRIAGRGFDDKSDTEIDLPGGSRFEGKGVTALNRLYFLDALNAGFRTFRFADENMPIRGDDGHGGTHVLMPMRLDSPAPKPEPTPGEGNGVTAAGEETTPAPVNPESADQTDNKGKDEHAEPETTEHKTRRTRAMPEKNQSETSEPTTLDKALLAVENARIKLREAGSALAELTDTLKAAVKEGKTQAAEVEKARATLVKLQAISL